MHRNAWNLRAYLYLIIISNYHQNNNFILLKIATSVKYKSTDFDKKLSRIPLDVPYYLCSDVDGISA
jgi:hypothetical protein